MLQIALNDIGKAGSLAPSRSLFEIGEKKKTTGSNALPFSDYLKQAMMDADELITKADNIANDFAAGRTDNIHLVAIAAAKADIALQFTMQIRNKIMDAYSEIMRMQI